MKLNSLYHNIYSLKIILERVYLINGNYISQKEFNNLVDEKGNAAVRERCELIIDNCKVSFAGYPVAARAKCPAFAENLELINNSLKIVIAQMLYNYFFLGYQETDIDKIVEQIIKDNPCGLNMPEIKYPYMVKSFLYAAYCGMTASTIWNGISQVNGGFITVCTNGDVVAHYALESDAFKTYLYNKKHIENDLEKSNQEMIK